MAGCGLIGYFAPHGSGEKGVNNPQTKIFFLIALKQQNISLSDNNIMTQTLNKKGTDNL